MIAFFQALCDSHGTPLHFALLVLSKLNPQPPNKWSQSQDHSVTAVMKRNAVLAKHLNHQKPDLATLWLLCFRVMYCRDRCKKATD